MQEQGKNQKLKAEAKLEASSQELEAIL